MVVLVIMFMIVGTAITIIVLVFMVIIVVRMVKITIIIIVVNNFWYCQCCCRLCVLLFFFSLLTVILAAFYCYAFSGSCWLYSKHILLSSLVRPRIWRWRRFLPHFSLPGPRKGVSTIADCKLQHGDTATGRNIGSRRIQEVLTVVALHL